MLKENYYALLLSIQKTLSLLLDTQPEAKIVYTNKSIFKSLESRKEDPIRNLIFEFNFIYRIINLLLFKSTF